MLLNKPGNTTGIYAEEEINMRHQISSFSLGTTHQNHSTLCLFYYSMYAGHTVYLVPSEWDT